MLSAPLFRHELHDVAVFENEIMRRHLAFGRTQPFQRRFAAQHAGVVQEYHVRLAAVGTLAVIGRWRDFRDDERIRPEYC